LLYLCIRKGLTLSPYNLTKIKHYEITKNDYRRFLNKLKSLTFENHEGSDKLITDLKTGLTLSYYTTKNDGKPQIVMYISDTKTNAHLQSWGRFLKIMELTYNLY